MCHFYTPGIYAEGYIVFVFLFVHSDVCSFVHDSMGLLQIFTLKFRISHQPLIRKHSYLDPRYPGMSAFIQWHLTPASMPQGGARTPLKSVFFFYFSVMERAYADSWSDVAQPCNMDLWVKKWRSAWPIFHSPFHSPVILPYILKQYDPTLT